MTEHVDVLIAGAGISGICAGYYLSKRCPSKTFAIVEARDAIGGTWDLFRYPGVRSDSDMYTLGYAFRPWRSDNAIGDGASIRQYVEDTAREYGLLPKIRFGQRVTRASWSSRDARWTVTIMRGGESLQMTCNFLMMCCGYYSYANGYAPEFPGIERFGGQVVHPQRWPDALDYTGKRVVVIGSGATAVTLVPAMAQRAAHVTMLQRSPTYIVSLPMADPMASRLRRLLPEWLAFSLIRWKHVLLGMLFFALSKRAPRRIKLMLLRGVREELGPDFDIRTHFTPSYKPWDQRVCLVPDGDLFAAIREGRASVATDRIETFTEKGVALHSGRELEADIVVTATGLNLVVIGEAQLEIDGKPIDIAGSLTYKGMMYSDVPNLVVTTGYTNASWTLKCELTCRYVCRLLNHMQDEGYQICTPRRTDPSVREEPWVDFSSGYVQRSLHKFPKQGHKAPWRLYQNYLLDLLSLRFGAVADGTLELSRAGAIADGVLELSRAGKEA